LQRVLVTAGASGIGLAIVRRFLDAGHRVHVADVDSGALAAVCGELEVTGSCVDVGSSEDVARLAEQAKAALGGIDVLVNNAGIGVTKPLEELDIADFDRVVAVNMRSALLTAKFGLPHMKRSGGAIVNIVSTRAFMSEPDTESYSASKGGLLALTHSLAISLARYRIRVNAVSPGWIDTSNWKKKSARRPAVLSRIDHEQHPAGRVGVPEDVARVVLFLADPASEFITGANVIVDGGMTVKMIYQ